MKKSLVHFFVLIVLLTLSLLFSCANLESEFRELCIEAASDLEISKEEYRELHDLVMSQPGNERLKEVIQDPNRFKTYLARIKRVSENEITLSYLDTSHPIVLERVQFYIETSESIRGYMQGGTRFQDVVNDLIGRIEGEFRRIPLVTRTVTEGIITYTDNMRFAEDLTNGTFQWGVHSPLHDIFRLLVDSTNSGDITIFVTDGIMSGTNQEIRNNRQFNVEQRTLLKNHIRRAFISVKDEFGMAIYAFTSEFNCRQPDIVYYDYQNTRHIRNFSRRPFYVFVFGRKELLPHFQEEILRRTAEFDYLESLLIGLHEPTTHFELFVSHFKAQTNTIIPGQIKEIQARRDVTPTTPMKFAVGLNLRVFPQHVQDDKFLLENLTLEENPNIIVSGKSVNVFSDVVFGTLNDREKQRNLNTTHYIDFTIDNLYNNTSLNIKIKNPPNNWYSRWSSEDDRNITADDNKTFNFEFLVAGILEAFGSDYVTDIALPMKRGR